MRKLFLLAAGIFSALSLSAASSQVLIMGHGKDAHVGAFPAAGSVEIGQKTGWDTKTRTKTYSLIYFFAVTKSNKNVKKVNFKFEAEKCDLALHIGHKKSSKMLWYSIKINGKELIKDTKKGEVIAIKNFPIEKVTDKKSFTFEASFRVPTKKELSPAPKAKTKSGKKK